MGCLNYSSAAIMPAALKVWPEMERRVSILWHDPLSLKGVFLPQGGVMLVSSEDGYMRIRLAEAHTCHGEPLVSSRRACNARPAPLDPAEVCMEAGRAGRGPWLPHGRLWITTGIDLTSGDRIGTGVREGGEPARVSSRYSPYARCKILWARCALPEWDPWVPYGETTGGPRPRRPKQQTAAAQRSPSLRRRGSGMGPGSHR